MTANTANTANTATKANTANIANTANTYSQWFTSYSRVKRNLSCDIDDIYCKGLKYM